MGRAGLKCLFQNHGLPSAAKDLLKAVRWLLASKWDFPAQQRCKRVRLAVYSMAKMLAARQNHASANSLAVVRKIPCWAVHSRPMKTCFALQRYTLWLLYFFRCLIAENHESNVLRFIAIVCSMDCYSVNRLQKPFNQTFVCLTL